MPFYGQLRSRLLDGVTDRVFCGAHELIHPRSCNSDTYSPHSRLGHIMFVIQGTCVDIETFSGTSARTGKDYSMTRYHILVGRSVYPCSLDDSYPGKAPERDEKVTAEARPNTFLSGNMARLDIRLLRPVEMNVRPVAAPAAVRSAG